MLKSFFESPSNRAGLSAWLATAVTALMQYIVTHHIPPAADLLGLVIGLAAILQPDNSVTVSQLEQAISDARNMLVTKTPASVVNLVADAEGIVAGVTASNPTH